MRTRIIASYTLIIALTGLFAFLFVRGQLGAANQDPAQLSARAKGEAETIASRLAVDGFTAERWLSTHSRDAAAADVIGRATPAARGDAARAVCDKLFEEARGRQAAPPAIVAFVDAAGLTVGRNSTDAGRGEDLGAVDSAFKESLAKGLTGTDIFVKKDGTVQYMASWAPLFDAQGKPTGALLLGVNVNDALARTEGSSRVVLVSKQGAPLGSSASTPDALKETLAAAAKGNLQAALAGGRSTDIPGGGLSPLASFGDGRSVLVAVASPDLLLPAASSVPYGILGATALGLIMAVVAGIFLGSYISRPIAELEEGLLAIINGQVDKRFNIEHEEVGGLGFRIDQLLNKLMDVDEDNTDEEGRVAVPSQRQDGHSLLAETSSESLGGESADLYYSRLYAEYIQAKQLLGEDTSAITQEIFRTRIQSMESEQAAATGRPVRYQVQSNGKEVSLLAVPLA